MKRRSDVRSPPKYENELGESPTSCSLLEKDAEVTGGRTKPSLIDPAFEVPIGCICRNVTVFDETDQESDRPGQAYATLICSRTRIAIVSNDCSVNSLCNGQSPRLSWVQSFQKLLFYFLC